MWSKTRRQGDRETRRQGDRETRRQEGRSPIARQIRFYRFGLAGLCSMKFRRGAVLRLPLPSRVRLEWWRLLSAAIRRRVRWGNEAHVNSHGPLDVLADRRGLDGGDGFFSVALYA